MTLNEAISLPSLQQKLEEGGYTSMEQLLAGTAKELASELGLNFEELKQLIDACDKERGIRKRTFQELIDVEIKNSITTSSKNINRLFEHGIPPHKITEICGESGSGKTQLCMQLALNVQLPRKEGGIEGECIYIDTEGSFLTSRFVEIIGDRNVDELLKGLHYFRILDHTELMGFMRQLPAIIKAYPKVKLIIIDSIAYHFRLNVLDARARSAILSFLGHSLVDIAKTNDLSVVVSNHVTQEGADAAWTPSLSSSWGNWCANRLFVFRKRHFRYAYLYKSFDTKRSTPVQFCIKTKGIMDPEESEIEVKKLDSETQAEINDEIDTAWVQLKEKHLDEKEQEKVDAFWSEACLADEFLSQLPPEMHHTKREEPNEGEIDSDVLYPKVEEEEDIPCTQQTKVNDDESTEDLLQDPVFIGSLSTLSSEEDPVTLSSSSIENHIPLAKVNNNIEISDMPPDLPSSLPYNKKRKHYDSQNSVKNTPYKRADNTIDKSPVMSQQTSLVTADNNNSLQSHAASAASAAKNTSEDDDDWDSDFEEELDYTFLDEISNSL